MRIISDIHIHSKYSRACSPDLVPEKIDEWGKIKGVQLIGTGDFTHPAWLGELEKKLEPAEPGFYSVKNSKFGTRFILSTEVACIYSQDGRVRRQHFVLLMSSLERVAEFIKILESKNAKLASDGRPILGMTAQEIFTYLLEADPKGMLIPAHVWTPYFGLFGSKSGFDSVQEAFGDMADQIYALETGLSSDPEMNWRISKNDKYTLVSSSDAHSLPRIGREANVMEIPENEFSFDEFTRIIKNGDRKRFKYTIEYFPEEGRYHMDGHADCEFVCLPEETKKHGGRCPECGKKITIGVMARVGELADSPVGRKKNSEIPGKHLVPLEEVLSECVGVGVKSKTVQNLYQKLIKIAGSEFAVILDMPTQEIKKISGEVVAEAIRRVRSEDVDPIPGYDGKYGVIKIFSDEEREGFLQKTKGKQKELF